ncbi:MAG: F0F1 ATP synthase subunit alpha, partial [Rhodobacteraceae bacterium]|nr:F0F1 ATP synthase subunit alpha [Paracoccaceae bacterium]
MPATDPALAPLLGTIANTPLGPEASERGTVLSLADGIARVDGLPGAGLNEVLIFDTGARGFVLSLDEDSLHAAFLDPGVGVGAGSVVRRSGAVLSVPAGAALLGRVLDPLGRPLDDRPA